MNSRTQAIVVTLCIVALVVTWVLMAGTYFAPPSEVKPKFQQRLGDEHPETQLSNAP
jgi:hypothetical protein